ncbi:MAG: YqaA family protein [Alphaproteobacteria bacterium]
MLTRLYDWTMGLAAHRHAIWWLAAISFAESSFFPIPPDVLIIAMVLAARERAWRVATVCTLASVAGGLAGYAIGALLYEGVGAPIIAFYGYGEKFQVFQGWYHEYGAWIVGAGGFTPIPYKVITIASGVADLDLATFTIVSALSRGARFFLVAALLWRFGPPIRAFIEARLGILTLAFFVLLIGSFFALRYLA